MEDLILGLILAQIWVANFFVFYSYWMLGIVASYHCMQCLGKLIQTQENVKKTQLILALILAHWAQI